ncbi:MAG: protein kinase [Planctomycetes bacterium]|nr:protein kinase [Planctomycetota bacterium]
MTTETPAVKEAFDADATFADFLQAKENGRDEDARKLLSDHPALAETVATFYALCARMPEPWGADAASAPGRRVGDYELLQEIGRGGMGVVYRAQDTKLNRLVAVKVMRQERFADAQDIDRFRRDAELLASLQHPNIVQIYHAGEVDNVPYFAMELVEGGSLAHKLADGWLPTPKQAAELVRVLAEAVQHGHGKGIIHRDLKPANVLLQIADCRLQNETPGSQSAICNLQSEIPKITDLGLAKRLDDRDSLTRTGAVVGTPSCMAPEQAKGDSKNVGPSADIYSLGAILYELLTGRPPFVGASLVETLEEVRNHQPWPVRQLNPGVPRDLETICLKCLNKQTQDRYASAADLARDLEDFLHDRPIQARPATWLETLMRTVNQTGLIADMRAYAAAYLIAGVAYLIQYTCVFLLARYEGPEWLIWLALFLPYTMMFSIFRQHRNPFNKLRVWLPDRQLWSIWIGHLLANFTMYATLRLGGRDIYETLRFGMPIHATLTGLAFFIMGCDYWGQYYLVGLAWMAAALGMALMPAFAPLVYGILSMLCSWHIAWLMHHFSAKDHVTESAPTNQETISQEGAKN